MSWQISPAQVRRGGEVYRWELNKLTKEIEEISDAEEMKRFAMLKAMLQVDLDD